MWSVAENDRYALTEDKCCGRSKRCNAKMIRGGRTRCQRVEIDGFGAQFVASDVRYMRSRGAMRLGVGAAGLGTLAAEIGGADFDRAAHFKEAGTHAAADALFEGVFAYGGDESATGTAGGFAVRHGIVEIVGG